METLTVMVTEQSRQRPGDGAEHGLSKISVKYAKIWPKYSKIWPNFPKFQSIFRTGGAAIHRLPAVDVLNLERLDDVLAVHHDELIVADDKGDLVAA